jgi:hypothetical protein
LIFFYLFKSFSLYSYHIKSFYMIKVLIILVAIMILNHAIINQKLSMRFINRLQHRIQNDPDKSFHIISLVSFITSPFLLNDGVCLLFTNPGIHTIIITYYVGFIEVTVDYNTIFLYIYIPHTGYYICKFSLNQKWHFFFVIDNIYLSNNSIRRISKKGFGSRLSKL